MAAKEKSNKLLEEEENTDKREMPRAARNIIQSRRSIEETNVCVDRKQQVTPVMVFFHSFGCGLFYLVN